MSKRNLWFLIGAVSIMLLAAAPLLAAMGAGAYADRHGCKLHEGFVNPCIVDGTDIGQTLYTLGVLGWFSLATIPLGAFALLVLAVAWIVSASVRRAKRPRSEPC
jgi:hypothetical protein